MNPRVLSSSLLLAVITLMGVGLVQVYSSSYVFAIESQGDGLFFFQRQLIFAGLGLVIMFAAAHIPFHWIQRWGWALWPMSALAVAATFIPGLGVRVGGALRWLHMPGGQRFEPSELLKIAFVLVVASLLARRENLLSKIHGSVLAVVLAIPFVLLHKQPDFGTIAILIATGVAILFAFGLKWRYILASFAVLIPAFWALVMMVPYRRARVMAFLDPWGDPEQKGFQVIQSMLSFHSGGLTGTGLGQGQGKLFFLPEAHTDFTLAVMGEEMGFVGILILLSLYLFIVFRGVQIAVKTEQVFARACALGFSLIFGLSVFINAGVVLGLLPTKGLTLPFLSYGGSSLVTMCLMMGLLLNIEKNLEEDSLIHRFSKIRPRSGA